MKPNASRWIRAAIAATAVTLVANVAVGAEPAAEDSATTPEPRVEWSLTYASRYAFQGIDFSDGRAVVQPWAAVHAGPVTGTVWANANQARHHVDEVDVGVLAPWSAGTWSGDAGWLYLGYPNRDWAPTQELVVDVAGEVPLAPTLTVHWDVIEGTGTYATIGVSHTVPSRFGPWQLGAKLHGQSGYYDMTGIPAAETTLGIAIESGGLAFTPLLTKLWTWDNGDWRGDARPQPDWMLGISVAPR